jgi:hypothetical protein
MIVRRDLLQQKWTGLDAEAKAMFKSLAAAETKKMRIERERLLLERKKPAATHVSGDMLGETRAPQLSDDQPAVPAKAAADIPALEKKMISLCRTARTCPSSFAGPRRVS